MRYLVNGVEVDLEPSGLVQVLELNDRAVVRQTDGESQSALAVRVGDTVHVSFMGRVFHVEAIKAGRSRSKAASSGDIRAPMPGLIVEIFVEKGDKVSSGQKLLVLEAMKMQLAITAPFDGQVSALPVQKGDQIGDGQLLVHIEAPHEQPM